MLGGEVTPFARGGLAGGADVQVQDGHVKRSQHLTQLGAVLGECLGSGWRIGANTRTQAFTGLQQPDADVAELFGLQLDARPGVALSGRDFYGGLDRVDRVLHRCAEDGRGRAGTCFGGQGGPEGGPEGGGFRLRG